MGKRHTATPRLRAPRTQARRTRRPTPAALSAGALLVGLLAGAAPARAAGAAPECSPSIQVLDSLPGTGTSQINDFGTGTLSVGVSQDLPVYWTGATVHRVPVPSGYTRGTVEAVGASDLMAGSLAATATSTPVAFSYRPGETTVRLLPGGTRATGVNAAGHIVGEGVRGDTTVGLEWDGEGLRRELPLADGYRLTAVTAINDTGLITGSADGVEDDAYFSGGLVWPTEPTAPPTLLDGYAPGDSYTYWTPTAIDDRGRVVGDDWYARADITTPATWASPNSPKTDVPLLGDRTSGTLEAISPTTGIAVGTALDSYLVGPWPPDTAPPVQAQLWPGTGPMLALPRLAPDGPSQAHAATDDERVGGSAADEDGVPRAVVWTCALEQAYVPDGNDDGDGLSGGGARAAG